MPQGFRRKGETQAIQVQVAMTLDGGQRANVGDWLVTENGEQFVLSDAEFRSQFEAESRDHQLVTRPREDRRVARGGTHPGRGFNLQRLREALSPEQDRIRGKVDPHTGETLTPDMTFERGAPRIKNIKLDAKGRVKEVDVQPEEWPPRNEHF